jgi:hypothetical protein
VHGQQVSAGASGDPRRPPDQGLAFRAAGERDHNPFPGRPTVINMAVGTEPLAVLGQRSGQPGQGELAQRRQGPDAERAGQCRFGVFAWVDVAAGYPVAQCFGHHVYQLDLVGGADDRVRHGRRLAPRAGAPH